MPCGFLAPAHTRERYSPLVAQTQSFPSLIKIDLQAQQKCIYWRNFSKTFVFVVSPEIRISSFSWARLSARAQPEFAFVIRRCVLVFIEYNTAAFVLITYISWSGESQFFCTGIDASTLVNCVRGNCYGTEDLGPFLRAAVYVRHEILHRSSGPTAAWFTWGQVRVSNIRMFPAQFCFKIHNSEPLGAERGINHIFVTQHL